MPFQSKAQWRKFAAMATRGEISESEFKEWVEESKPYKKLPDRAPGGRRTGGSKVSRRGKPTGSKRSGRRA